MRRVAAVGLLALALAGPASAQAVDQRAVSVGMRGRIEQLVLPGTELRARPLDDPTVPVVLRVLDTWPHGRMFRYDLEYVGLEPGTYDLTDYLERLDGSSTDDLPEVRVEVAAVLPGGLVHPNPLQPGPSPGFGGYGTLLVVAGVAWVLGLLAILFVGQRRRAAADAGEVARPVTLADRLRPRVEAAMAGELDDAGKAELERLLLTHWRTRLGLGDHKVSDAMAEMRRHPDAGALLRALEEWLHRPGTAERVDVAELLRPYRDVPAEGAP